MPIIYKFYPKTIKANLFCLKTVSNAPHLLQDDPVAGIHFTLRNISLLFVQLISHSIILLLIDLAVSIFLIKYISG
jgi:hypothetical protein